MVVYFDAMRRLLWLLPVVALTMYAWSRRAISHPPGVLTPDDPVQTDLPESDRPTFEKNGYHLTGLARFQLRARVLTTERYRYDREAELVPEDVAFGWGKMSDSSVIAHLDLGQWGRFYHYSWTGDPPLPPGEIISHSANMHLIPATPDVENTIKSARKGHVMELTGYLVRADARDGWQWMTSLTRFDTGGGACELVWVETASLSDE